MLKARAGAASSASGTAISVAARAGRRRAASAAAATRERPPAGRAPPDRARVDPLAEQREQGRQGEPGDRDADRSDDDERRRQREEQRPRLQERREEDRGEERRPGEQRRPARGAPRDPCRLPRRGPPRQLLAKAGDDEQRVVDPEGEAHHRADDDREGFDRHHGVEQDEDSTPGEDGEGAEGKRDRRRHQRAEDQQEDDQEQRHGDQLGALGCTQRFGLQSARDAGVARLDRLHRRVDVSPQGAFERRHGSTHRHVERQVVVEEDDRPAAARAQEADRAAVPGRDDGDGRVAAKRPDQVGPLPVDRRGRARAAGRRTARTRRSALPPAPDRGRRGCPGRSARSAGAGLRRRARAMPRATQQDQDDDRADDGPAKPRLTRAPPHGEPQSTSPSSPGPAHN